jgi:hypothetical protein
MFLDEDITEEQVDEIIEWAAKQFFKYGMETAAILFLESYKPISRLGASMGTVFFTPLLPIFGDNTAMRSEKVLRVFQEEKNVERLIKRLEEIASEEKNKSKSNDDENNVSENTEKKGWRKYIPFL